MNTLMVIPDFQHVTQPAFVDDVVDALMCCLIERDQTAGDVFEVGSREQVSYRDLIAMYAECSRRTLDLIDVPWAPRWLGAAWIAALSGLPYSLIRALSDGLTTDLCIHDERLYDICPIGRTAPRAAIQRAVKIP